MENNGQTWFFKAASQSDIEALKAHLRDRGVEGVDVVNPPAGEVFFLSVDGGVMDGHDLPATLQVQRATGAAWQPLEWA